MTDFDLKVLMEKEEELNSLHSLSLQAFTQIVNNEKKNDEEYLKIFNEYHALSNKYRAYTSDMIDVYDRYVRINCFKEEGIEPPTEEDYERCISYDLHDEYEAILEKINKLKEE